MGFVEVGMFPVSYLTTSRDVKKFRRCRTVASKPAGVALTAQIRPVAFADFSADFS